MVLRVPPPESSFPLHGARAPHPAHSRNATKKEKANVCTLLLTLGVSAEKVRRPFFVLRTAREKNEALQCGDQFTYTWYKI